MVAQAHTGRALEEDGQEGEGCTGWRVGPDPGTSFGGEAIIGASSLSILICSPVEAGT